MSMFITCITVIYLKDRLISLKDSLGWLQEARGSDTINLTDCLC